MCVVSSELTKLAKVMYKGRDVSHGMHHVSRVRDNAMLIAKRLNITDSYRLIKIETAALFHDLWDHKYLNPLSMEYKKTKDEFKNQLKKKLFSDQEIKDVEIINIFILFIFIKYNYLNNTFFCYFWFIYFFIIYF